MRIENKQLYEFIKDAELIKAEDLDAAFGEAKDNEGHFGEILLKKKLIDEVKLRQMYAYILGVPFVDLSKEIIPSEILHIVPERISKK